MPRIDTPSCSLANAGGMVASSKRLRRGYTSDLAKALRFGCRDAWLSNGIAITAAREVAVERRGGHADPPCYFGKGRAALCQQGAGKVLVLLRQLARAASLPPSCPGCGQADRRPVADHIALELGQGRE